MGDFMQVSYFFRPIWRLWDFKGTTGRAEYFTYAVASFLLMLVLTVAVSSEKRFRNILITGAVVIGGTAALSSAMAGSVAGLQIQGGKKVGVNRKMSPFKADGTINNRTSILGGRRAHLRGGRPVKASRNRYTL